MVGRLLHLDRTERVPPDVQRDEDRLHPSFPQTVEQHGREVQPRGGRGHAALDAGVDRLVTLLVLESGADVRRQRQNAGAAEIVRREAHAADPVGVYADDLAGEAVVAALRSDPEGRALSHPPSRPDQGPPRAVAQPSEQQQLDPRARSVPRTVQPRRHDAAVVEDQHVALAHQVGQLVEAMVRRRAVRARDDHEPGVVARLRGRLRDQTVGEPIVEVGGSHAVSEAAKPLWK